jgi:hypothetical protein
VDPSNGNLLNTDNGAPLPHVGARPRRARQRSAVPGRRAQSGSGLLTRLLPAGGSDPLTTLPGLLVGPPHVVPGTNGNGGFSSSSDGTDADAPPSPRRLGAIFQGGCYRHLHAMLGVASGSQVLYVGDHIYGDIVRSKKTLGWRTALVVPELAAELRVRAASRGATEEFRALRCRRDALDDELQRLEWALRSGGARAAAAAQGAAAAAAGGDDAEAARVLGARIAALREERDALRELHRAALRSYHATFHEVWGQLMKTGYSNSRFASQVERFACLYTSHVGNLLAYSPDKSYRKAEDALPHEERD